MNLIFIMGLHDLQLPPLPNRNSFITDTKLFSKSCHGIHSLENIKSVTNVMSRQWSIVNSVMPIAVKLSDRTDTNIDVKYTDEKRSG